MMPSLILMLGGLLLGFISVKAVRTGLVLLLPPVALLACWQVTEMPMRLVGLSLLPVHAHPYSLIFAAAFCIAAFAGGIFALHRQLRAELAAAYIYAGAALGVVFSGDLISLFIFWEIMAIASTVVILCGGTEAARRAAFRYALMHAFGGVMLLIGIAGWASASGSLALTPLGGYASALFSGDISLPSVAVGFILVGVLVNAAAPPFSAWLPDAYPEASPSGAVFLSAFTTKAAVFVLLTLFAGTSALIWIGLYMIFYGILYAMLENDARRILSYSVVNQVGFMVAGIGIGSELALAGVATHAFCHIIYKALLFMSAGAVLEQTGKRKCTELGGLWHSMRFTAACAIIGAISISAFPLTSGFVSKSMVSAAAAEDHLTFLWVLLLAASAGVLLHAGVKFPWFVFFAKDRKLRPQEAPLPMRLAMGLLALLCILPGLFPGALYSLLPVAPFFTPYTGVHVVSQLQLLLFSGLAFFVMLRFLGRTPTLTLDTDFIWRVWGKKALLAIERIIFMLLERGDASTRAAGAVFLRLHRPERLFRVLGIGQTGLYAGGMLLLLLSLFLLMR